MKSKTIKPTQPTKEPALGLALLLLAALGLTPLHAATPFAEAAADLPEVSTGSVAWGDYDNDGDLDLLVTGATSSNHLSQIHQNQGAGLFQQVTTANLPGVIWGSVAWGDLDNDNDLDIVLTGLSNGDPLTAIYLNRGGGQFEALSDSGLPGVRNSAVALGDCDNDGDLDLLLTGDTPSGCISRIYANRGGTNFTVLPTASLPGARWGAVAWGDRDSDGDLDILLTGETQAGTSLSAIYENLGEGRFQELAAANLPGIKAGAASWGDCDQDGDLDILLSGYGTAATFTRVYANLGAGRFQELVNPNLPARAANVAAWGDCDNDGDLDILLHGYGASQIFTNDGTGQFGALATASLTGGFQTAGAWGDYDGDGDLDVLLTGLDGSSVPQTRLYRNQVETSNTPPSPPTGLTFEVSDTGVVLRWAAAADAQTPSPGLSYNLRIGTTPGGTEVMSPHAAPATGFQRLPQPGNRQHTFTTACTNLEHGLRYYWSVQAVDTAFAGSAFAAETSFTTLGGLPPAVTTLGPTGIGPNDAAFLGSVNPRNRDTLAWFEWGPLSVTGQQTVATNLGNGRISLPVVWGQGGLVSDTTYSYLLVASNEFGISRGQFQFFTTLLPAIVATLPTSGIAATRATFNGTVNPKGVATTVWYEWGASAHCGSNTGPTNLAADTLTLPVDWVQDGLAADTTYYYRLVASNAFGICRGQSQSFTTLPPAFVTTLPAGDLSTNRATLCGTVNPNGVETTAWFEWGTSTNYGQRTLSLEVGSGASPVSLSGLITNLLPKTVYHYRLVASNEFGLANGQSGTSMTLGTLYVWADSLSPAPPYNTWATAAHTIQEAVNAAVDGDTVLVTNGVYSSIGVNRSVTLQSVNGAGVTIIDGQRGGRCATLGGQAVLRGFALTNGTAEYGGGVYGGTLYHCVLTGNWAKYGGGGAYEGTLHNCTLTGNSVKYYGGGSSGGALFNCVVTGNSAEYGGGGVCGGTIYNCTVTANSAPLGGGAYGDYDFRCAIYNSILYYNSGANCDGQSKRDYASPTLRYYDTLTLSHSCTTPLFSGEGNIDAEPQLLTASHLSPASPCIGAGSSAYSNGVDIDGEPWLNPPCMGADQVPAGSATGPLTIAIRTTYSRFAAGFAVAFRADNTGPLTATAWDCGDGTVLTNQPFISHAWMTPGTYEVRLTGFNDDHLDGVTTTLTVEVLDAVHYVNQVNPTPEFPYATWQTAARTVQEAIAAGGVTGRLVVVTNGVYADGTVGLTNVVRVESVNGPAVTIIDGGGTNRCATVADYAILSGFTLTNGYAYQGGGVWSDHFGVLTNCIITDNLAVGDDGATGGGVFGGAVYNCILTGNSAEGWQAKGGGAFQSRLYHCTLSGNSAWFEAEGGGAAHSMLQSCTLIGNSADSGGGAFESTLYDCTLSGNSVEGWTGAFGNEGGGGGAYECTLRRCTLIGNSTRGDADGGGAHRSTLYDCTLTGNIADSGGGACHSKLNNCVLTGNYGDAGGGAAFDSMLYDCTLDANSTPQYGGGAYECTLANCVLTRNSAGWGGGASDSTLTNCILTANSGGGGGGGAYRSTLHNCTLTGNSASDTGGAYGSTLHNCIVYYNFGANHSGSTLRYSCTTPLPPGQGNIDADPQLASTSHLSAGSPCIGAGNSAYSSGVDIDGEPWADPPCTGADQLTPGQANGELSMTISTSHVQVKPGFVVTFAAHNTGPLTASAWDFGDGTVVTNQPLISHAWVEPGAYQVRLTGYNDSHPAGVTTKLVIYVGEGALGPFYVNQANSSPVYPYTNWQTAATSMQQAIDAARSGSLVWVTNGVYGRVVIREGVRVESVNGAEATIIDGQRGGRCATLGEEAVLRGFTLTNGFALVGGGAHGGALHNCVLTRNEAYYGGGGAIYSALTNCVVNGNLASWGGGVYENTLYNCTLAENSAEYDGGGAAESRLYNCTVADNSVSGWEASGGGVSCSTLYNCTLTGNAANYLGGGTSWSTLYNCIVVNNSAQWGPNHSDCGFAFSCTSPLPTGTGNIEADPGFENAGAGDFRLSPGSPCIDAGMNLSNLLTTDLAGLPRHLDGNGDGVAAFDMGAYEFDLRTVVPTNWFTQFGLDPTDPHVVSGNPDQDAHTTFQEWQADTDPTNTHSCFHITSIAHGPPVTVQFLSSLNRVYTLRSATNLTAGSWSDVPGQADVPGTGAMRILTDTNAGPAQFYRVRVRVP